MKYFLHVLVMGMLFSLHSFSQTITYKTGFPNSCNVFDVATPLVVNGFQHYAVSGGVGFFQPDSAITLPCQRGNSNSSILGTAYAIQYPFKEGYTYNIKVVAWQPDLPSNYVINLSFSMIDQLPDPNKSLPHGCGGAKEDAWIDLAANAINNLNLDTNTTTVRDAGTFLMDQPHNYLTLVAWINSLADILPTLAYVQQIIIKETPPTYTLAPASITKVCGTPLSQTFTITDVHNSGKVSAYTWNLGSANNGWLYNGAPAPQTITTTTPTLDLTADGCTVPSNVTASATRPGGTYSTNPSIVTNSLASITLNGPSQICDVANFTIDGLPCGATVAWSLSPAGNGTLSSTTGSSTTLTRTGTDRHFIVTAYVTTACGNDTLSRGLLVVGQPDPFLITSPEIPCQSGKVVPVVSFNASPASPNTTYNWSWEGTSGLGTLLSHTSSASGKFSTGSYTVTATAFNACGITEGPTFQFNILTCQFVASEVDNIMISPNPASNVITVTTTTTAVTKEALKVQAATDIREVRIIDKTGALLRKQSFPAGTTTATINVESFKPDIYILQIGDGKTFKTRRVTIFR